jgi:hypothetical protein
LQHRLALSLNHDQTFRKDDKAFDFGRIGRHVIQLHRETFHVHFNAAELGEAPASDAPAVLE